MPRLVIFRVHFHSERVMAFYLLRLPITHVSILLEIKLVVKRAEKQTGIWLVLCQWSVLVLTAFNRAVLTANYKAVP